MSHKGGYKVFAEKPFPFSLFDLWRIGPCKDAHDKADRPLSCRLFPHCTFHISSCATSLRLLAILTFKPIPLKAVKNFLSISVDTICRVKDIIVLSLYDTIAILLGVLLPQFRLNEKFSICSSYPLGILTLPRLDIIIVCCAEPVSLFASLAKKDFIKSGIYFKYGLLSIREVKLSFKSSCSFVS